MIKNIIEIQNITKQYKGADFLSVDGISLNIREGETFGLLGPNGAGKTTLISMLCGLVKPTSGTYTIGGHSSEKDIESIKNIIGIVPQEYALYPTLTAYENLMYFGSLYGLKKEKLKKIINNGLQRVGLSEFADRKVKHFSGGMKRRCNLLAGILHQPKVLFLDEPTVGVDVQSRKLIIDYLKELNAGGMTIIYTSHHLNEAEDFCTHIAIVDQGRIFVEGSPKELIAQTENARNLEDVFIALTGKDLRDAV